MGIFSNFHKIILKNGERNNNIDGEPNIPCNLSGNGNNPAPAIENVKVKIIRIGNILSPLFLHTFNSPIIKKTLKMAHKTKPIVNINWDFVPIYPNALTIFVKWL